MRYSFGASIHNWSGKGHAAALQLGHSRLDIGDLETQ
jgi:hypothetical protein